MPTAVTQPTPCIRITPHTEMIFPWLSNLVDTQKPSFPCEGFVSIVLASSVTLLVLHKALAFVAFELVSALYDTIACAAAPSIVFTSYSV